MPIAAAIGGAAVLGTAGVVYSANKAAGVAKSTSTQQIAAAKDTTDKQIAESEKARLEAQRIAEENAQKVAGVTDASSADAISAINSGSDAAIARLSTARGDYTPYTTAGVSALNKMLNPTDEFSKSPDYQFRLDQAIRAATTSKATNGMLRSGSALRSTAQAGSDIAGGSFNDWWNKQSGIVNTGLQAQGVVTGQDTNAANVYTNKGANLGNVYMTAAQIKANVLNGGANNSTNAMLQGSTNINNAIGNLGGTKIDAIGNAGTAQGNAAIATGNAIASGAGSISDLIQKYMKPSTGSSYDGKPNTGANAPAYTGHGFSFFTGG